MFGIRVGNRLLIYAEILNPDYRLLDQSESLKMLVVLGFSAYSSYAAYCYNFQLKFSFLSLIIIESPPTCRIAPCQLYYGAKDKILPLLFYFDFSYALPL